MAERLPSQASENTFAHDIRITAGLSREFLQERPGWLAHYVRQIAQKAFEVMEVDDVIQFEGATLSAEFIANAEEHGGVLNEFDIAHFPPQTEADTEALYLVTTNPAKDETTPGTDNRGKLAAAGSNETAESGRGLLMADVYTDHNWGQRNVISPDGKHEIVTFAVLSSRSSGDVTQLFEDAA